MDQKRELIISVEEVWKKFQEHLDMENNNRILFSWKYGTWKTYFLNNFFNSEKGEYEVFHLYPINYQITSNDDIIKYLKYDILVELLKKDNENGLKLFERTEIVNFLDYSILSYLFFSDKENALRSIKTWIEFIPELGRPISETVWIFEKIFNFKKQIGAWEKWIVEDFLNQIKDIKITENDLISELVKNKINELKRGKKSILILDDLDRMDPEHIFRLLNIFWAHFDKKNNDLPNKFWFDKIILVCDYENIKGIFEHRYWEKADFNWYIDKFFSIKFFDFNNRLVVESFVEIIIQKYIVKFPSLEEDIKNKNKYYNIILSSILVQMTWLDWKSKLNLRELLKPLNFPIDWLNSEIEDWVIWIIEVLLKTLITILWEDKEYLLEILNKIKMKNSVKKYTTNRYSESHFNSIYWYFIFHIYWKIINYDYKQSNTNMRYKNYNFAISTEYNENITMKNTNQIYDLFYDLLMDYIKNHL